MVAGCLSDSTFNEERCRTAASDPLLLATDLADFLVERGVPFRSAHHYIGELVAFSEKKKISIPELEQVDAIKICPELGDDWREVFDLNRAFLMRERPGMPGPSEIKGRINHWEKLLSP